MYIDTCALQVDYIEVDYITLFQQRETTRNAFIVLKGRIILKEIDRFLVNLDYHTLIIFNKIILYRELNI